MVKIFARTQFSKEGIAEILSEQREQMSPLAKIWKQKI